jgi:hypothetical protein
MAQTTSPWLAPHGFIDPSSGRDPSGWDEMMSYYPIRGLSALKIKTLKPEMTTITENIKQFPNDL